MNETFFKEWIFFKSLTKSFLKLGSLKKIKENIKKMCQSLFKTKAK